MIPGRHFIYSDFKIGLAYGRIAWVNLLQYPVNFLLILVYWGVSMGVLLLFWKALFQFIPGAVGEWDFHSLSVLNSLCYVSWGFFTFFWGLHQIPEKVLSGRIDQFLARPMHPLLGLVGEEFHLEGIYEIASGLLCIVLVGAGPGVSFFGILNCATALTLGTLCLVFVHGVLSLLSFWFGRVQAAQAVLDSIDDFQKYPAEFFPHRLRSFLVFIIPVYFPGTLAAKALLGRPIQSWEWITLLGIFIFWSVLFFVLYRLAVRRYESCG